MSIHSPNPKIKLIEVGKFYLIHDGSKTGHPGFIVSKNDAGNRYLVIITESDKKGHISKRESDKRHVTDLDYPTDNSVVKSYIKKRPMLCKRKDIGSKELIGMSFNPLDMKKINQVAMQNPTYAPSFKK